MWVLCFRAETSVTGCAEGGTLVRMVAWSPRVSTNVDCAAREASASVDAFFHPAEGLDR